MHVLRLNDYKRMPWKNGGGETLEIAVCPADSPTVPFDWRVSMATVASDGPFSSFPGIDRVLTVIDGDAMELTVEGRVPILLDQHSEPYGFPGDLPTSGRLRDGPIVDLNVMARRGLPHAVTRLDAADLPRTSVTAATLFVVALEPVVFRTGSDEHELQPHDTVSLAGTRLSDLEVLGSGPILLIAIG